MYEYWDDPTTGEHVWSRHNSDHGNPKHHENPHDHMWKKDDDHNTPGPPLPPNPRFRAPTDSKRGNDDTMKIVGGMSCAALIGYGVYVGIKWTVAIITAPTTASGSIIIAGMTP